MQTIEHAVVLFTDIADYTGFVASKGSAAAMDLLRKHNSIVQPIIEQFGGRFVKSTGDGIIACFQEARSAVEAAVIVQQRLAAYNMERPEDDEIHIRVGLHIGEAVIEPSEIVGHAVNFAARLVAFCGKDQIFVSKDLHKRVRRLKHLSFRRVGLAALKGISDPQEVFEVRWDITRLEEKQKSVAVLGKAFFSGTRFKWGLFAAALLTLVVGVLLWSTRPKPREPTNESRRFYDLGREYLQQGDDDQALTALNQAISADPNFSEAYLAAAETYHDIAEDGKARKYAEQADQLSASLSNEGKLKLKGLLAEIDRDWDGALQVYKILVDGYPRYAEGHLYLASIAMRLNRFDDAKRGLQACLELEKANQYCQDMLMMLQIRNNQFDDVLRDSEKLRKEHVNYPWFDQPVGIALWGKDEIDKAVGRFRKLGQARSTGGARVHGTTHFEIATELLADIALYQGRIADGKNQIEQLMTTTNDVDVRATYLAYLSAIEVLVGDPSKARLHARKAASITTDTETLIEVARQMALLGSREEALDALRRRLPRKGATLGTQDASVQHFIQGALALAQGRAEEAIKELSLSNERLEDVKTLYTLAQAYMAAGQWGNAAKVLDSVVKAKGKIMLDSVPSIWPLAHYRLAVCHEKLGKEEVASSYYLKFLKLWEKADGGLRPLIQARKRAKALQFR